MELEEVKSHYRNKITEMESAAKKQERKGNNIKENISLASLLSKIQKKYEAPHLVAQVCLGVSLANSG